MNLRFQIALIVTGSEIQTDVCESGICLALRSPDKMIPMFLVADLS